jgi:hypothetical protein
MTPVRLLTAVVLSCLFASLAVAKGPQTTKPDIARISYDLAGPVSTVPVSVMLDSMYDYEVWSAPAVTGETEFVIWGRMSDNGQWDEVHRFGWTGSVDHGSWQDMGVWKFTSEYYARKAAENLMKDGEITDFTIIEQQKSPQWSYEETFDTEVEAIEFADDFEDWSVEFGNPHVTKIVPILVNDLFQTRTTSASSFTKSSR